MKKQEIINIIEEIFSSKNENKYFQTEVNNMFKLFIQGLNSGEIRSAEFDKKTGNWFVNQWVKKGILLLFKFGKMQKMNLFENFNFFDKSTISLRKFDISDGIRIVPGGSTIRNGAFIGKNVICMPPMYINIGAFVDENTMIDSHALVGTCAQIGKNVHLSAASQIGGVLEPVSANPVIVEDNVMIGGNCGIYEGVIIKKNAILGSGVILNSSVKVYDLINEKIITNSAEKPLTIPENAVVVQGARMVNSDFGKANNLSISTPLIVKYRDKKTDAKTELENALR